MMLIGMLNTEGLKDIAMFTDRLIGWRSTTHGRLPGVVQRE